MFEELRARIAELLAQSITVVVTVLHSDKLEASDDARVELRTNPTMSGSGMEKIWGMLPTLIELGEFAPIIYASRLSRALDTASIMALELDRDIATIRGLGQHANKCPDGSVVYYPGCEAEGYTYWQESGIAALREISLRHPGQLVLVASHRPIVLGVLAFCLGKIDIDGIKTVVNDPTKGKGFFVFAVPQDDQIKCVGAS